MGYYAREGWPMIDPWEGIQVFREGDGDVLTAPTGGEYGSVPASDYQSPPDALPNIYRVWEKTIAVADGVVYLDAGDRPDRWIVSSDKTANQETRIWSAEAAGGSSHRIGTQGHARLPGISRFLWLQAVGGASSQVVVMATRGYPDVDVTYGD